MNVFESLKLNHSRTKRAWGIFSLPTEIGELGERVNRLSRGIVDGWEVPTGRPLFFSKRIETRSPEEAKGHSLRM